MNFNVVLPDESIIHITNAENIFADFSADDPDTTEYLSEQEIKKYFSTIDDSERRDKK